MDRSLPPRPQDPPPRTGKARRPYEPPQLRTLGTVHGETQQTGFAGSGT